MLTFWRHSLGFHFLFYQLQNFPPFQLLNIMSTLSRRLFPLLKYRCGIPVLCRQCGEFQWILNLIFFEMKWNQPHLGSSLLCFVVYYPLHVATISSLYHLHKWGVAMKSAFLIELHQMYETHLICEPTPRNLPEVFKRVGDFRLYLP